MLTTVAHFVSTYDWKEANAAVVCILSHGDDHNLIYGVDSVRSRKKGVPGAPSVQLRDLITKLNPKQCPGLEGKPKLFFIQACRGERGKMFQHFIGPQNIRGGIMDMQFEIARNSAFFPSVTS